jgi:hypothetical protein
MGYDIRLFLPQTGIDLLITAEIGINDDIEEINPGYPDAAKEIRKRTMADALLQADPSLEDFKFDFEVIAAQWNFSVGEAKIRFRHIELNSPEGGPGIQIVLYDDRATLSVPYWHKKKKAKTVFEQIWQFLKVIQKISGYAIYDPQMERMIRLDMDLDKMTMCYSKVVQ